MVRNSLTELSEHVEAQDAESRVTINAISRQASLRAALLRDHMAPLASSAQLELAGKPELAAFTLPKSKPSLERLAQMANGMARAAEPYTATFVQVGLKPDFVPALHAAAAELMGAQEDKAQGKRNVKIATSALRMKLGRARKVIRVVDRMVRSALVGNEHLLDGWKQAKRVPQTRGSAAIAATPITPAAAPAAVAA